MMWLRQWIRSVNNNDRLDELIEKGDRLNKALDIILKELKGQIMNLSQTVEDLALAVSGLTQAIVAEKDEAATVINELKDQISALEGKLADLEVSPEILASLSQSIEGIKSQTSAVEGIVTTPVQVDPVVSGIITDIAADPEAPLSPAEAETAVIPVQE